MYQIYQILPGETIDSIATKLNIDKDELKKINGITDETYVRPGGYIIVPNKNQEYKKYVVKKGDSLYSISKVNNMDYKTLSALNGLDENDYIYPNQELLIPIKRTYVTEQKETVGNVLKKLNTTVDKISDLYLEPDQVVKY